MAEQPIDQTSQNGSTNDQSIDKSKKLTRHKGIVSTFIHNRSFGFIKSSNQQNSQLGKQEIFFHKNAISKSNFLPKVKQNDKCSFELSTNNKGIIAYNINIYYRPNKHKQLRTNKFIESEEAALFTNTMLQLVKNAPRSVNKKKKD